MGKIGRWWNHAQHGGSELNRMGYFGKVSAGVLCDYITEVSLRRGGAGAVASIVMQCGEVWRHLLISIAAMDRTLLQGPCKKTRQLP